MEFAVRNIAVVCNPTRENARALKLTRSLELLLTGMDICFSVFTAQWPSGFDTYSEVWIVGGDGTLNHFINQYPEIDLPLALFPGGSGNDFHWMLYGAASMEVQLERVLKATPRMVDAGYCNGRFFLNGLGVGFDGAIVQDLLGKRKMGGKASYLLSILKNIVGYHEKFCHIEAGNFRSQKDCFLISVANSCRYGGGFNVAPRASVTDGLLDVNVVGKISPFNRMRYLPVVEKGEHLELPFVEYVQETSVTIRCQTALPAHLDGEFLKDSLFEVQVLPKRFSFLY